jgi:hypothetical protein
MTSAKPSISGTSRSLALPLPLFSVASAVDGGLMAVGVDIAYSGGYECNAGCRPGLWATRSGLASRRWRELLVSGAAAITLQRSDGAVRVGETINGFFFVYGI